MIPVDGDSPTVRVVPLASGSAAIPVVAGWLSAQWGREQGHSYEDTLSWCAEVADSRNEALVCAFLGELPVGAGLLVECDLPSRDCWRPWLSSLYVPAEHRGKGIGRALIAGICEAARRGGWPEVYLYAVTGRLTEYYAGFGWRPVERMEFSGVMFDVMKRTL
ncbi:MAG: GNAT family N-acetyltransferase [Mesorhizobium sp.]|uniref:GNAT family N-acetyltransferase n=1 Tax=Mesorhizobium sp. TaxID=1871066 RepID=UPI001AC1B97E|nr:GNAT family N-acetyltransferase [Mesorhizobium sp.]MBN9216496.1 GNAT family N-acetyltransferase [Mesorhizobium sp.]